MGIVFINGIFILVANLTNPGTVTDEAYEKGLAYNRVVEQAQAQHKLGWHHKLVVRLEAGGKQRVVLRLRTKDNDLLVQAGAMIRFYRPVKDGLDFDVPLKETRQGTYLALVPFPEPGIWDAYIAVRKGEEVYRAHERVIIR